MKSIHKIALYTALLLSFLVAISASAGDDEEAILNVIERSYVKAIHAKFDEAAILSGFHPAFIMFVRGEEGIDHVSIAEWVGRMKNSANMSAAPRNVRFEPKAVNVTGDAASACIDLYRDGRLVFTDYFLLYKIDGEWKIVGKVYQRH